MDNQETEIRNPDQPAGYVDLVRTNHEFRKLWFGQIISVLGDWFNLIASASLVGVLTQSGIAVGGLLVVRLLASFLVSLFAGVLVDRFNRKRILVATDIIRGLVAFGFLLVREPEQVWLLYVLTAIQMGLSGLFTVGRRAILPEIVARDELGTANTMLVTAYSTMLAFGSALGGLATGRWGIYPSFMVDGATFFISALFISIIKYQKQAVPEQTMSGLIFVWKDFLHGMKYLALHKSTLAAASVKALIGFAASSAAQVVQIAIAGQIFVIGNAGAVSLGLLYALFGVGAGVGPVITRRYSMDAERPMRIAILSSFLVAGIGLAFIASLANFPVVLFGTFLRGIGIGVAWVFSTQLLYQLVPTSVQGRVFAAESTLFTMTNAAGVLITGWAIDSPSLGISTIIVLMIGFTLIGGIIWYVLGVRRAEPVQ